MFTRCPECQTVHALNAAALARASGAVRCGQCDATFDALSHLFDHRPASDSSPPRPGAGPPVLGAPVTPSIAPGPPPGDLGQAPGKSPARVAWITAFVLLVLVTVANLAWTFREPLLAAGPVHRALVSLGLVEATEQAPVRDPSRIHLVSRDLHAHPARDDLLVLSVVFVNRAAYAQPYPDISLTLTDAANLPLARRTFEPGEYLAGRPPSEALAPEVHVPVLLEIADPGQNAVGFELEFE
ncbi:MAG: DUF3426 domain-containing protein [Xanthomonadales bacterium]|nr:DUF3426 domain-containing protein [Xanthomonadales bacterium]